MLRRTAALLGLLALVGLLTLPGPAHAQIFQGGTEATTPLRPVTRTFAITNARVVQAPGRVMEGATVIVRDGRIESVGRGTAVPFDADVIAGDSLWVYAGFLDALSHVAVTEPDEEEARGSQPGAPTPAQAGVRPERNVRTLLDASSSGIEQFRNVGFAIAHVVPEDGMLPGQGALITLAGDRPEDMLLVENAALRAALDPSNNSYPGTSMGVMAVMRQLFENARRMASSEAAYARDPLGLSRPPYEPQVRALFAASRGEQPVFFEAEDALQVHRVTRLARELGLNLVLTGVRDSRFVTDLLARREIPVVAGLELPDALEAESDSAETPLATFPEETRTFTYEDVETETARLRQRRRQSVGAYERNPAALRAAGIPFAFGSGEANARDIRGNLRRMVEAGLAPDAALAALTTDAAALLGLGDVAGTVEPGRMAHLVVTDGDYFAEDTKIRFVFVDGHRFEVEAEEAAREGADPDATVTIAGTWDYEIMIPGGSQDGTFTIEGSEGDYSGSFTGPDGEPTDMVEIVLEGNTLSFALNVPDMGRIEFSGLVDGDTYNADVQVPGFPGVTMEATRRPS